MDSQPKNRHGDFVVADDPTMTVSEFCQAERLCPAQLYKEWKRGTGPDFYYIGSRRRISQEARLKWRRGREAAAAAMAPKSTERQSAAGQASAAKRRDEEVHQFRATTPSL